MSRNLAEIVTVESKNRMFQKDRICWVTFKENGYEAIVPNDINVGDKMCFIGEGSLLPEIERWEFLRKRCYCDKERAFRISPMTMGKKANEDGSDAGSRVKSWGLCVTLEEAGLDPNTKAGTDVTEALGIRKYEPAEDASPTKTPKTPKWVKFCMKHALLRWIGQIWFDRHKKASGNFPSEIIEKSDETTIQNYKKVLEQFPGKKAFITAKMEGCSATYSLDVSNKRKPKMYLCSRNNRYNEVNSASEVYFEYANRTNLEKKLIAFYKKTGKNIVLQGELCAGKIQGNIYAFDESRFFVYRMKLHENGKWVEYNYERMTPIIEELGLERVPLIEVVDDMGAKFQTIDQMVSYTEQIFWKPVKDGYDFHYQPKSGEKLFKDYLMAEGIVVKSADYNKEENTGWSVKCKNLPYQEHDYKEMHTVAQNIKYKL